MSDTQNKWVPVSERLPEPTVHKQILLSDGSQAVAFIGGCSGKWTVPCVGEVAGVTHWMDLPEPPKPADPFEAWWWLNRNAVKFCMGDARLAWDGGWDAAKEHYAKPLPDFETWWDSLTKSTTSTLIGNVAARWVNRSVAQAIWNAAQGKPEA